MAVGEMGIFNISTLPRLELISYLFSVLIAPPVPIVHRDCSGLLIDVLPVMLQNVVYNPILNNTS